MFPGYGMKGRDLQNHFSCVLCSFKSLMLKMHPQTFWVFDSNRKNFYDVGLKYSLAQIPHNILIKLMWEMLVLIRSRSCLKVEMVISLEPKLNTWWLYICMFWLKYRLTMSSVILQNFNMAFECKKAMWCKDGHGC